MQNHILEEARKIDLGQPIAGAPIPVTQNQSRPFLDYGVPALLIGAGLAWYIARNEQRLVERAKTKGQVVVERLRESVEERFDRDEKISRSVKAGVSESLMALEPAGSI